MGKKITLSFGLGVSSSSRRWVVFTAIFIILLWSAASNGDVFGRLPDLGSSADTLFSAAEQRAIGQAFMQRVRKNLPLNDDPLINDYLQTLGDELVKQGGIRGEFHFFLVDRPQVNAFAGPSGNIGVFSGLILAAATESELAAVLAHEIAHVSQKHLLRMIESQRRMTIPAAALLVAAVVLGSQMDPQVGAAAAAGTQGAMVQRQINFTRAHEEEADRIGIEILAKAGYDPFALPGFFEQLGQSNRTHDQSAPEFLRTHPVTSNRIADALARAERFGHRQRPDRLSFHLVRARLRQQSYRHPQQAVTHFAATLRQQRYRNATAERYGYALALLRDGQLNAARRELEPLLSQHPRQLELILLNAELDQRQGHRDRALRDLKRALELNPNHWPLIHAYATALLAAQRPAEALTVLERVQRSRPQLTGLYPLLADAARQSGQQALHDRYRAETLYWQGDLELAIRELELALRRPELGFHLASQLQVRLDELKLQQREQERQTRRVERN